MKREKTRVTVNPNDKTKKAIDDVEKGVGVKMAKNIVDLKRQLGL